MLEENWVSVNEKLPEVNKHGYSDTVLVSVKDTDWDEDEESWGCDQFSVTIAYLSRLVTGVVIWKSGYDDIVEEHYDLVTHWMPLPEPMLITN